MFHVEFITVLICLVCFSLDKFHLNLIQVDGIAYCFHVKFFFEIQFFFEMFCFSLFFTFDLTVFCTKEYDECRT